VDETLILPTDADILLQQQLRDLEQISEVVEKYAGCRGEQRLN
jgi:hypothetical protein